MKLIIGLTGGIGSGKTLVSDELGRLGAGIVDTDKLAHGLTTPDGAAITAIREHFGPNAIAPDGSMDRHWMREKVFADPASKKLLESILHPLIRQQSQQLLANSQAPYLVLVVPLLVEAGGWQQRAHRVLVVDCPEQLQIVRVQRRSQLPEPQIRAIMAQQATRHQRLAAAHDVLFNDGTAVGLLAATQILHEQYLLAAKTPQADLEA
jgi:dephospho-CoA kinase